MRAITFGAEIVIALGIRAAPIAHAPMLDLDSCDDDLDRLRRAGWSVSHRLRKWITSTSGITESKSQVSKLILNSLAVRLSSSAKEQQFISLTNRRTAGLSPESASLQCLTCRLMYQSASSGSVRIV